MTNINNFFPLFCLEVLISFLLYFMGLYVMFLCTSVFLQICATLVFDQLITRPGIQTSCGSAPADSPHSLYNLHSNFLGTVFPCWFPRAWALTFIRNSVSVWGFMWTGFAFVFLFYALCLYLIVCDFLGAFLKWCIKL